nr:DUF3310 domain-containing protein [Atopococcus tabaci]
MGNAAVDGFKKGLAEPFGFDLVNHPNHYQGLNGLEAREVHENFIPKYGKYGGMVMCDMKDVIKYVLRAPDKNGVEDLKKAKRHLEWAINELEGTTN